MSGFGTPEDLLAHTVDRLHPRAPASLPLLPFALSLSKGFTFLLKSKSMADG